MLRRLYRYGHRTRVFKRAISSASALRLALAEGRRPIADVLLSGLNHPIRLRTLTSDVLCFEKVFITREYQVPFPFRPRFIVDAGANIGMASLFFRKEYPEAKIVSIEPESSNFDLLTHNCRGLTGITLCKAALWPEKCELRIQDSASAKWAFSVKPTDVSEVTDVAVSAVTIPEIMAAARVDRIDLLKLDIETAEKELFSRNTGDWLDRVDLIIVELHDRILPGCARQFYEAIRQYSYVQEVRGENVFVKLR